MSQLRGKHKVTIGLGDSPELLLASRVHSNNAEAVPLALVMMLLIAELMGGSAMILHIAGGALFAARIFHAIGMPRPAPNFFRFTGIAVTWGAILGLSAWVLYLRAVT